MLAAWRGATVAVTRAKYKPALYDDERQRARSAPAQTRPAVQPGTDIAARNRARFGKLGPRQIEKVPAGLVLDLHDPDVRVKPDLPGETFFHRLFRHRLRRCRREHPLDRPAVVIGGLRRRRVQHRVAVEQRQLDEHRPRLLRAAPAHGAEHAFGLAAAQVSRDPDAGF